MGDDLHICNMKNGGKPFIISKVGKKYTKLLLFFVVYILPILLQNIFSFLFIEADSNCTTTIIKQLDTGNKKCDCNVACQENDFSLQLSSSMWPSNQYLVWIKIS